MGNSTLAEDSRNTGGDRSEDRRRAERPAGPALPTHDELIGLVETVAQMANDAGRADLVQRLEQTHGRLRDPNVRVIVVGEFKQGKSKLINALVNAPVCPIGDDIATSVPTAVGYGDRPGAWVLVRDEEDGDHQAGIKRIPVPIG